MFKSLFGGFIRTFALNEVRHLATYASGAIAAWLLAHGAQQSDATSIAEGAASLIIGAAGFGFSEWLDTRRPAATVALPSGKVIEIGKASNVAPADEAAETAALNRAQAAQ